MLKPSTLKFLKELKKNNNKPWFDRNRSAYDAAKADFLGFIQQVIDLHGKYDAGIRNIMAKDCIFRINRDIRFARDKSPYKTNMGASINQGGRKSMDSAGYYFHLEPGGSFTGGGIYVPLPEALRKVRQEIDYNLSAFSKILQSKPFRSLYGDLDRSSEFLLSRVPKGYEPENPAAGYLKFKSYIAMVPLSDSDLLSKTLVKKTVDAFRALQPLVGFLNKAITD